MIWVGFVPHSLARNSTFFPVIDSSLFVVVIYLDILFLFILLIIILFYVFILFA